MCRCECVPVTLTDGLRARGCEDEGVMVPFVTARMKVAVKAKILARVGVPYHLACAVSRHNDLCNHLF